MLLSVGLERGDEVKRMGVVRNIDERAYLDGDVLVGVPAMKSVVAGFTVSNLGVDVETVSS